MPRSHTALVVDDDDGLAQIVAAILGMEGFAVETADNGIHGYASYFHQPTDWVITDIQMPELDGLGMMRSIRTINPHVKTIYMSGEIEKYQAVLDRETAEFAVQILRKPFTRDNLVQKIISDTRDHQSSLTNESGKYSAKQFG
jgi:DNA-binding NtrC family response regulator